MAGEHTGTTANLEVFGLWSYNFIGGKQMNVVAIPRFYNKQTGREVEAFNLFVRGKSRGNRIFYVKLRDRNGNAVSGHYTTRRADYDEAKLWVVANYDKLLNEYNESLKYRNGTAGKVLHHTLENYFRSDSNYLKVDRQFGIERTEQRNKDYASLIGRILIPYLSEHHLYHYNDLTVVELNRFQLYCVNNNISNKIITEIFYALKIVFNRLVMEGTIERNFVNDIVLVKRNKAKEKGIFNYEEIAGLFDDENWEGNEDEYMIHLIGATTGLRNSEIRLLNVNDFETVNGIQFIDVKGTKTENAKRKVPVHNVVYEKIQQYIKAHNRKDYIFLRNDERIYTAAEISNMIGIVGEKIGCSYGELKERNITFHSWRHLYSTMLYGSGQISSDWIEYFMGHKQSGVKGVYTHLNNVIGKEVVETVLKIVGEKII